VKKEEFRQIIREENERILKMYLDAKSTAIAMENGAFYSKPVSEISHNKPAHLKGQ
jgi:hypothetical protein